MAATAESTTGKRKLRKRADGEGSIHYSESKKLWIGRLMVGYRLDGKPDIREASAKSQKDCRAKLDALKGQAAGGTLPSADLAGLTVGTFLDRWLATVKPNVRERTYRRYEQYVGSILGRHSAPSVWRSSATMMCRHSSMRSVTRRSREERARRRGRWPRARCTICTWSSVRPSHGH